MCPVRKAKVSGACYAPRPEERSREATTLHRYKTVTINGQQVTALLDSGSFMSLVKCNLVPVGTVDYQRQENILCVHGDERLYPKADVTAVINEQSYLVTVVVVEGLPVDAVLGWDLPILLDLLLETDEAEGIGSGERGDVCMNVVCPVVTRAQAKADVQPLPGLDSSLCEGGTKGPRKVTLPSSVNWRRYRDMLPSVSLQQ